MPSAEYSVTIDRPLHEVFAFVTTKENDPRWRPAVVEIERVSGEGTGARYRQLVKGPTGKAAPADFEVTGLEPGKRYAFRTTSGPVQPEGSFEFAEEGGATRVTFELNVELKGKQKMMAPMVTKVMRSEVSNLDRLKTLLESG